MFKKTAIAAVILGLSSVANAGAYQAVCKPGDVNAPCTSTTWDFGADALVLQNTSNQVTPSEYKAKWGWGFGLQAGYHFAKSKDVNVNWEHFSKSTKNTDWMHDGSPFRGDLDSKLDVVNLDFAQTIQVDSDVSLRFYAGVQYAQFNDGVDITVGVAQNPGDPLTYLNASLNYRVKGWGPMVGLKTSYNMASGFGIFADGSLALLSGSGKTTNASTDFDLPWLDFDNDTINYNILHASIKMGGTYDYVMDQGMLTARVGWEVHEFVNGITDAAHHTRDATWQGVFFGLKWAGDM